MRTLAIEHRLLHCRDCLNVLSSMGAPVDRAHEVTCGVCKTVNEGVFFARQEQSDPTRFPALLFMSTICGFACGALVALLAVYVAWRG